MNEIYVSIDIETDGPAPGLNSMLALGAAAYDVNEKEFSTWYSTLYTLPEANADPKTAAWWLTQPDALEEVRTNQKESSVVIPQFVKWVKSLPGKPIAVAWPAAFDFAFVNYYCHRFAGENPLGFACLDIRSFANGLAKFPNYYGISECKIKELAGPIDKTDLRQHVAVDDAIEQGRLFMGLRKNVR